MRITALTKIVKMTPATTAANVIGNVRQFGHDHPDGVAYDDERDPQDRSVQMSVLVKLIDPLRMKIAATN